MCRSWWVNYICYTHRRCYTIRKRMKVFLAASRCPINICKRFVNSPSSKNCEYIQSYWERQRRIDKALTNINWISTRSKRIFILLLMLPWIKNNSKKKLYIYLQLLLDHLKQNRHQHRFSLSFSAFCTKCTLTFN